MAYVSDGSPTRGLSARPLKLDFAPHPDEWTGEEPRRDLKKLLLVIGLGGLSWVATYVGMLELIEANMGELPIVHKVIIGFSVAMLMTMIVWLLDQMFAPIGAFTRLCYMAGYLFLSVISVGFGFGFYWKVLESRSESSRSAESAVAQVQGSLHAASTRLEQLNATLSQLAAVSLEKADLERTKGTSCPNSRPGDGPRRKMREDDAARFSFASDFVKGRVTAVKGELKALDTDLARIVMADKSTFDPKTGTRNEFMKGLGRKLDMTVTGFNAFRTDPQLKQLRSDLSDRANTSTFGDLKKGGFSCPDQQLQAALHGAVRAIEQLPELEKPEIAAVEGSEATIEAFRRLTATFYGALSFKLPPSADELRELQKRAVRSVEGPNAEHHASLSEGGLSKRDYVPLAIAIFVDVCLLLVSMGRPVNRLHGLVPKMRAAERGPVIQILSRFNDIHRDPQIRQNFELFRHVVFDWHGDYYVAVPLHAPTRFMQRSGRLREADIEDLEHEAHLLSNLFTSFEKERIFKRVYNPLLNTRAIQKRLERQGSKFAEVEAFRIYRFRDGAWSEIILGAVMGAARRVEAEKQRQSIEREIYRHREPDFVPPMATTQAPEDPSSDEPVTNRPMQRFPTRTATGIDLNEPEPAPASRPLRTASAEPKYQPSKVHVRPQPEPAREPDPKPVTAEWESEPEAEDYEETTRPAADYRAKFGPYAAHVATGGRRLTNPPPHKDGTGTTAADPDHPTLLHAEPAEQPEPDKIDVVFSRETATVSVPASEAVRPGAFAAMMRRVFVGSGPPAIEQGTEQPIATLQPEPEPAGPLTPPPLPRRVPAE